VAVIGVGVCWWLLCVLARRVCVVVCRVCVLCDDGAAMVVDGWQGLWCLSGWVGGKACGA